MKSRAIIYIVLAGLFWGTSGVFLNYLTPYGFTSLEVSSIRGIFAAIAMGIYILFYNKNLFKTKPLHLAMFAFSGISVLGTAVFYFLAIQATSISTAVVLMYTAPMFVLSFSVVFLKEKLTAKKMIAIVGIMLGCVFVSGIIGDARFSAYGIIMGLLSGISYSLYNIITKIEMLKGANSYTATFYSFLFMGLFSLFICDFPSTVNTLIHSPLQAKLLAIGIGVINCVLPYVLYTMALKEISAGVASSLSVMEPMFATLFSIIIFDEKLSFFSVFGIVLILSSSAFLGKNEKDT